MKPTRLQRLAKFWRVTLDQLEVDERQAFVMFLYLILLCNWWFGLK